MNSHTPPAVFRAADLQSAASEHPPLLTALTALAGWISRVIAARRAAQHLHSLDDRLLADMGLTRRSIDDRVRRRVPDNRSTR